MDTCECYEVHAENQLLDVVQCDDCRLAASWEVILLGDGVTEERHLVGSKDEARSLILPWEDRGEGFASIVYDPEGHRHRLHEDA